MRTGVLALLAVVMGAPSVVAPSRTGELAKKQQHLLRYCRAMYHGKGADDLANSNQATIRQRIIRDQHAAKRYFGSRSTSTLEHELVPIRKSLHRGSFAYCSVAYTLSYYGVDILANARRVLGFDLDVGRFPKSERSEGTVESGWYMVRPIREIYERHPDRRLWLLAVRTYLNSGTASEGPPSDLVSAFERYPTTLLWAWPRGSASDNEGNDWSETWADELRMYGSDPTMESPVQHPRYTKMRAFLLKLTKSPDPTTAQAARKLRRAFLHTIGFKK